MREKWDPNSEEVWSLEFALRFGTVVVFCNPKCLACIPTLYIDSVLVGKCNTLETAIK